MRLGACTLKISPHTGPARGFSKCLHQMRNNQQGVIRRSDATVVACDVDSGGHGRWACSEWHLIVTTNSLHFWDPHFWSVSKAVSRSLCPSHDGKIDTPADGFFLASSRKTPSDQAKTLCRPYVHKERAPSPSWTSGRKRTCAVTVCHDPVWKPRATSDAPTLFSHSDIQSTSLELARRLVSTTLASRMPPCASST